MTYRYATQVDEKMAAKAVARSQPISAKQAIEVASFIRGKTTAKARVLLTGVLSKRIAVPYRRFNGDVGHKKGIGPGRYPQKTSQLFLKLIREIEANASVKGLDEDALTITSVVVQRGPKAMQQGRQRGRVVKNVHVEIVAQGVEKKVPAKKQPKKAAEEKPAPKAEKPIAKEQKKTEKGDIQ